VLFELNRSRPAPRGALARAAAYLMGVGLAALGFLIFLFADGISLEGTYFLLFRYHTLSNAHSAYHNGLLRQVAATPQLLVPIVLGAVAWLAEVLRRRRLEGAYLPAVAVWLVLQGMLVSYPYKQYYAPWFLFASVFVVVLGRRLAQLWRPLGSVALAAACLATVVAAQGIASIWVRYNLARADCVAIRIMNVLAGPDDRVAAPPPHHPVARRDVFFLWFNTSDPEGYDSERILESLGRYRDQVAPGQYAAALATHNPAFVVLDAGPVAAAYPAGQWRALVEFLPRHGYRVVQVQGLRLALRPDRYQALANQGLFVDGYGPLGPLAPGSR
jgi:hypothetical protein